MTRPPLDDAAALPELAAGESLIDSHCHLDMAEFAADREAVLRRARAAGVGAMVTIGAGGPLEANDSAVALAEQHPEVFATVGVHPHEASIVNEEVLTSIAGLAGHPRVVAIGETGLDYHYDHSPRPAQQSAFRAFVALARRTGLPIVVHLRAADDDAVSILREEGAAEVGGVIHCFSGDAESARRFLDLGFHLSFSGIVTFRNAEALREAARITPAVRLLVETDAPFLAPVPYRGRRNEPALAVQTAATLAAARGESLETVAAATRENTIRLFRLPMP
jgi:TatD DNase family protein